MRAVVGAYISGCPCDRSYVCGGNRLHSKLGILRSTEMEIEFQNDVWQALLMFHLETLAAMGNLHAYSAIRKR
jgi:hypothetical protein